MLRSLHEKQLSRREILNFGLNNHNWGTYHYFPIFGLHLEF